MFGENKKVKVIFYSVLGLLIVVSIALGLILWQYFKTQEKLSLYSTPEGQQKLAEQQVTEVINEVSRHLVLPQDKKPESVFTIQDREVLVKDNPFYQDALNGDQLVLYSDRAIIYSPSRDKIVNIGPVIRQDQENQQQAKKQPVPTKLSVEIRNGSTQAGAAKSLSERLKNNYSVLSLSDAENKNYNNTVIVNVSGKDVSALEKELGVTASTTLPQGESSTSADILVIIGNN